MIRFRYFAKQKFWQKNLKLIFLLAITACALTDRAEDTPLPGSQKSVVWLDKFIELKNAGSPGTFYVSACRVNLKNFYLIHYCCAFCHDKRELYDENGVLICIYTPDLELATSNCSYKLDEIEQLSIYWQPPYLACDL